jgi:hypothetical protein
MLTVITKMDTFLDVLEKRSVTDTLFFRFIGAAIDDVGITKLAEVLSTGLCPTGL